ncbi:MAG: MarR family transcriptional regulator [Candidatus Aquicultor sp.]|nr:MarR family transcriptional regulator [Candidatus Aquicultor sp.]
MQSIDRNTDEILERLLSVLRKSRPQHVSKILGIGRAEHHALRILSANEGCDISTFAANVGVRQPTATVTVDRLVEAGFVTRTPCVNDRRVTRLHLTDAGRDIVERSREAHRAIMVPYIERLTPKEQEELIRILKKMGGV